MNCSIDESLQEKVIGNFVIKQRIGQGQFGKVVLAQHKLTLHNVAIKILDKSKIKNAQDHQRLNREMKIMKKMRHPYVIQLYEIYEDEDSIYLIMEHCTSDLSKVLRRSRLSEQQACKYFQQMICAIEYIHQIGIAHRDLKPQNILIDHEDNIKIIDFGLSNFYSTSQMLKSQCGSLCYAAPEILETSDSPREYNGLFTDIWALGVILYNLLTNQLPFTDGIPYKLTDKIRRVEYVKPKILSDKSLSLIERIFVRDPNQRADIKAIKQTEFFNLIPFQNKQGILPPGPYPIDEIVIQKIHKNFNILPEQLRADVIRNKFNSHTAIYHMLCRKQDKIETLKEVPKQKNKFNNNCIKQPYIAVKSPQDPRKNLDGEMEEQQKIGQKKIEISLRSLQPQDDFNKQLSYDVVKLIHNDQSIIADNMMFGVDQQGIPKIIEPKMIQQKNQPYNNRNQQLQHKLTSYPSSINSFTLSNFNFNMQFSEMQSKDALSNINRTNTKMTDMSMGPISQNEKNNRRNFPQKRLSSGSILNQNQQSQLFHYQSGLVPSKKDILDNISPIKEEPIEKLKISSLMVPNLVTSVQSPKNLMSSNGSTVNRSPKNTNEFPTFSNMPISLVRRQSREIQSKSVNPRQRKDSQIKESIVELQSPTIQEEKPSDYYSKDQLRNQSWYQKMFKTKINLNNISNLNYFSNPKPRPALSLTKQRQQKDLKRRIYTLNNNQNLSIQRSKSPLNQSSFQSCSINSIDNQMDDLNSVTIKYHDSGNKMLKANLVSQPFMDDYTSSSIQTGQSFFQSRQAAQHRYSSHKSSTLNMNNQNNNNGCISHQNTNCGCNHRYLNSQSIPQVIQIDNRPSMIRPQNQISIKKTQNPQKKQDIYVILGDQFMNHNQQITLYQQIQENKTKKAKQRKNSLRNNINPSSSLKSNYHLDSQPKIIITDEKMTQSIGISTQQSQSREGHLAPPDLNLQMSIKESIRLKNDTLQNFQPINSQRPASPSQMSSLKQQQQIQLRQMQQSQLEQIQTITEQNMKAFMLKQSEAHKIISSKRRRFSN
ncbi:protein kinase domain containing protein [Stylonychia lemnae]|uniref:Protein kinase domain containing protein n=1 Tax=Stylonychia lemnae TaxID=5949 RepID=A0A078B7T4_STYLE|nr:protein kinase domain containing protein [Stylonychia lemnae]|eukprot:CDW90444.1 protein kinase domain containing protein [Stylonychia lemnae]